MAAVAVQVLIAAVGLERPAEELLARRGVLSDQQDCADAGGPGEGAVDVGQSGAVAGGVAVGAVAAVAGGVEESAGLGAAEHRAAARLGLALGRGAFGDEPEVSGVGGMAELPGVAPAVGGGIGVGADHREGGAGVAGQSIDLRCKGPESPVKLHADSGGILAGPLPGAGGKHLAEHLISHSPPPAGGGLVLASLVRSSRPWLPIPSHSLPSGSL